MAYRVVVTREDDTWLASIPAIDGGHTWARSLTALDGMVRDLIGLELDLSRTAQKALELDLEIHTGDDDTDAGLLDVQRERGRLAVAERALAERTVWLAESLVRRLHVSVRDAARLLHLSPQRVSQLVPRDQAGNRASAPHQAAVQQATLPAVGA